MSSLGSASAKQRTQQVASHLAAAVAAAAPASSSSSSSVPATNSNSDHNLPALLLGE